MPSPSVDHVAQTTRTEATRAGRRQTEAPVPRWAEVVAHLIPLLVLPSGLWRLGLTFSSMGMIDENGQAIYAKSWEIPYVVGLTIAAELFALTAFGLVRRWGEFAPRWIPLIGGRRVPPMAAVVPATLGGLALIVIWAYAFRDVFFDFSGLPLLFANDWWAALMITCYAPLNLWGPLLLVLTWAYYRRRMSGTSERVRRLR